MVKTRGKKLPISFLYTFFVLLIPRLISASYSIVDDCDEIYNYWEPLHYLVFGQGMQTWEYSPEHAIRSWFYVTLHAIPVKIGSLLGLNRVHLFYLLRMVLAAVSAFCESRLVVAVARNFNRAVALHMVAILLPNAGMWAASTSFLPSSFAMYAVMLALSYQLSPPSTSRTVKVVACIVVGAVVGWPFCAALIAPFMLLELYDATRYFPVLMARWVKAGLITLAICAVCIVIDSLFYGRLQFVAWNIVRYNVFSSNSGPDLYGTEPWYYYLANLVLQHNFIILFALVCAPLVLLASLTGWMNFDSLVDLTAVTAPFYLWLGIFTLQPHKEERFMYPAYPVLCLTAAIGLDLSLKLSMQCVCYIARINRARFPTKTLVFLVYLVTGLLGVSRIVATMNYASPMDLYASIPTPEEGKARVCVGKEWYRYPSSFFLPDHTELRFLKSEFDGILPGEFKEPTSSRFWDRPGIRDIPEHMNDLNLEEPSRYVPIDTCDYIVDSLFSYTKATEREPIYAQQPGWRVKEVRPFIDTQNSKFIGRAYAFPLMEPKYGLYQLLVKDSNATKRIHEEAKSTF
ncbi:mannosyltransferase complex subunit Alg9 [Schizosaccharomyces japonicus yFS275]|uniref:Mannosyltransferase n=1 Tax=Schizosaccharomyces japonicus (strain yFS275 / FY16936) TaxID=402676 RepID=B6JVC7_SCHJY|nr:mannosyltransferase complex subunit Alg9 [Schizosaccharomyces japonicus yFS275]EEB05328.1 mannosyltransferase complex subunit Alg9 [Schizosaccharomyces japonicus yFS275]